MKVRIDRKVVLDVILQRQPLAACRAALIATLLPDPWAEILATSDNA